LFKIDFFVEDKHLPHVLRSVTGQVRDLRVVPVVNAAPAPKGKVAQTHGTTLETFAAALALLKPDVINAASLREATQKAGFSPTSYSHFLHKMLDAGLLKKDKTSGSKNVTYSLVK
jgi:hypothetical protein